jgi:ATP-dependent DNA helicase PIF1
MIRKNANAVRRITTVDVITLDEISMLDREMLPSLDYAFRILRNNSQPFGGVIFVLTGDFIQLENICNEDQRSVQFIFEHHMFRKLIPFTFTLSKNYRCKDPRLRAILAELRTGKLSQSSTQLLESRIFKTVKDAQLPDEVVYLYPKWGTVDHYS